MEVAKIKEKGIFHTFKDRYQIYKGKKPQLPTMTGFQIIEVKRNNWNRVQNKMSIITNIFLKLTYSYIFTRSRIKNYANDMLHIPL